jgi:LacI family transcriptional regulator
MITIKKMAELLGTSTTTVSNVINGKSGEVSPVMVEKVKKLIDEYDYVLNMNARNLARNQSGIIGLAMKASEDKYDNFVKDPFAGELIGAVERFVRAKGYFTMLYVSSDIEEIITSVSSWNVDGLILLGMQKEDGELLNQKVTKPMVFVDAYFKDASFDYVNVGIDDRKGGREITKYLMQSGHTKIAFLADNCVGVDYQRYMGYRDALKNAGLPWREENFIRLKPSGADLSPLLSQAYERVRDFTALICASDYYAANILNDLKDRGMKIPQELSIVGFDDNVCSRLVRPALTTVHQDVTEKSRITVEKLFYMINGKAYGTSFEQLPIFIVERSSVRKM